MNSTFRIALTFIIAMLVCTFSYSYYENMLSKYQVHNNERLTELLVKNTYYDVLFLGSSRTHFDINPSIIDSICHVSSYNAGIEGGDMYEFEMILKSYLLKHPPPKYLFLNIDMHSFTGDFKLFNYPLFYPYFNNNEIIKRYLLNNNYLSDAKIFLPFLRIADYDDNTKGLIIKSILGQIEISEGEFQSKGYISNTDVNILQATNTLSNSTLLVNSHKVDCLDSIIKICNESKIKLILTYLPEYLKLYQKATINRVEIFDIVEQRIKSNKLIFLRDDDIELCFNPKFFANITHLNKEGAIFYSNYLANNLKLILTN